MSVLKGKVALIPGAKGGLGIAVTRSFLEADAKVVGVSRSIAQSDFPHPEFAAIAAEISSTEAARKVVAEVMARYGRIDALVQVMGGFAGGKRVEEIEDATLEKMLDVNFRAAFYMAKAVLPHMRAQGSGRILVVASRQGVEPAPTVGAYSASKAAVISLVRTIALENRDRGITANAVLPGTMDTPGNREWNPQGDKSWVQPDQVAAMLVHLASDAAAQVTGATIPIYGAQI